MFGLVEVSLAKQLLDANISDVARTFPGERVAHPRGQNEEENRKSLRKNKKYRSKFEERMRIVKPLPTQDCEAGYGPG